MDVVLGIPGVGEVLEVKQYVDFLGRFKKEKRLFFKIIKTVDAENGSESDGTGQRE